MSSKSSLFRLVLAAADVVCSRSKASMQHSTHWQRDRHSIVSCLAELTAQYFNVMLMGYARTGNSDKFRIFVKLFLRFSPKAASTAATS